ncbi:MAG: glycosyltransferase family 2 protein [Endomicrobium sp.]|jgi:glycosyltransferase involved in cell wall biosynthesis|nr:glycosyltransferase family 2 protein [Endomicrobium sp.]
MANLKVSVIIPVYNTEEYLKQCLDSVCNQTLKDIEIICINDGSSDGSLSILKEYASKDKRIIVISQDNQGAGAARNVGLEVAKGKYVAFVDSDDWVELNMLEKLYPKAEETSADIVLHLYRNFYEDSKQFRNNKHFDMELLEVSDTFSYKCVTDQIFKISMVNVTTKFYNRLFIVSKKELRFQNLFTCNDVYFGYGSILLADKITSINDYFYNYRVVNIKKRRELRAKYFDSIFKACNKLEQLLRSKGIFTLLEKPFYIAMKGHILYEYSYVKMGKYQKQFLDIIKRLYYEKYFRDFFDGCALDLKLCRILQKLFSVHYGSKYKVIIILGFKITKKICDVNYGKRFRKTTLKSKVSVRKNEVLAQCSTGNKRARG